MKERIITCQKNTVQVVVADCGPCSYVRWRNWAYIMNAVCNGVANIVVTTRPMLDDYTLSHTATAIVARPITNEHSYFVRSLAEKKRKYGYKVMVDIDDILFDLQGRNPIPSFNPFKPDPLETGKIMDSCFDYSDGVIVTNVFLKACVESRFNGMRGKIEVFENFIPTSMFMDFHSINDHGKKLNIVYGGAANHFTKDNPGDFEGPWIDAIYQLQKTDKFTFTIFGSDAGPFDNKKTLVKGYVNAAQWPSVISRMSPDVYIGPLVDHPFNRCKSDLKFIEACAIGSAFVGSYFNDSPYRNAFLHVAKHTSANELAESIDSLRDVKTMEEIVSKQKNYLLHNNRTMESKKAQDRFMKLVFHKYLEIL